jgi:hypothetical protein
VARVAQLPMLVFNIVYRGLPLRYMHMKPKTGLNLYLFRQVQFEGLSDLNFPPSNTSFRKESRYSVTAPIELLGDSLGIVKSSLPTLDEGS